MLNASFLAGGVRDRTSVAVIGAGAIGGVFAQAICKAGHDVSLCVRSPFEELVVATGAREERVPAQIVADAGQVRPVRWVLLAVKAFDTPGAKRWLTALCTRTRAGDDRRTCAGVHPG